MNVVLFGPAAPLKGGVPLFTETLAAKLRDAGHNATIVGFRKLSVFSGEGIPPDGGSPFVPWRPSSWKLTAQAIARHNPDIILAMWWLPIHAPAYRAVRKSLPIELRKRWIYVVHDVISHDHWPGERLLAKFGLRMADRFLVLSRGQENALREVMADCQAQIMYAPHPLYDTYRRYVEDAESARKTLGVTASRVLLFFGYVRAYKGLDLLLRALPEILRDQPDTQLLIAGPYREHRAKYQRLIRKLGIGHAVVIHDHYFSGDDVGLCFAAADCVILPYRRATQSGVIPIAYALNTPAIATRVAGLEEYLRDGETGYLIEPDQPAAIAEAVRRFFDIGGKNRFAEGIEREAARFSWNSFIETLEKAA